MIVNYLNNDGVQKCTREEINRILECSLKALKQPEEIEINIAFVSADEIKRVNEKERNKPQPTDVLSFPAYDLKVGEIIKLTEDKFKWNINPENNHFSLGDILLCKEVAKNQAKELKHTLKEEFVRLTIHSLLHLLGYDHIEDGDYEIMHKKELELLKKCGYENLD